MNKLVAALALGAAITSSAALGQAAPPQAAPDGASPAADVTRQETQQMADNLFKQLDANHDGSLTKQEAQAFSSRFGNRGGRVLDMLFAGAQSITLQQFEAMALARFDAMDSNHDGTVSAAERAQARAAMKAAMGAKTAQ